MKTKNFLAIISTALFITGCTSIGGFHKGDTTLERKNFRVVKKNVRGEDTGFNLFCIIPFAPPSYADAMGDLHDQIRTSGGSIALANVTNDIEQSCFILFGLPKTTISADVIEFTE